MAIEKWATKNNLVLNKKKSFEMIIYSSQKKGSVSPPISTLQDIERVDSLKILGVTMQNNLSMKAHIADVCQSASQSLYALKLLKSHGLDKQTIFTVCRATVLSRLTYASPAWWGLPLLMTN